MIVQSRAEPTDTALKVLRTYKLSYQEDLDTRLPRLQSVSVSGQEGTEEATTELPVSRYEYGTATLPATPLNERRLPQS